MAERKGNKKRLCINLSLFTLTDNNSSSSNKSPKKFEDPNGAVVGLGIVAAMNKESNNRAAIIAISPRSTTSNPIPVFTSFKKPSIEEMEMCEEYTCVISHVGTNLVKKREYFDGQFIGNSNFNAYQKTVYHTPSFTMADFLNSCFLCKKQLKGLDIFMYRNIDRCVSDPPKIHYFWRIRHAPVDVSEESEQHRGEKAFCSAECRCTQISIDEHKEKCGSGAIKSLSDYSVSPCSGPMQFFTGVAVA